MDKISIIIPVYNTEKYLRPAIDSILNQSYKNLEIIFIDDCSTDNSPSILDGYAKNDSRIKIIRNKKNKGVGASRNLGLAAASGKYIMFLDSDDAYKDKTVEYAYKCINSNCADIVLFGEFLLVNNSICLPSVTTKFCKKYYKKELSANNLNLYFINSVWNKIFKRQFLIENKIEFVENIKVGEDTLFCISCILNKPKVYTLPNCLYIYRLTHDSSTAKASNATSIMLDNFNCFVEDKLFQSASNQCKINIINRYFKWILKDYNDEQNKNVKLCLAKKIQGKLKYLKKWVGIKILEKCSYYKHLSKIPTDK